MVQAIRAGERVFFQQALESELSQPGNINSISTMMRLALESVCPHIRYRASRWLKRSLGVVIVDEGADNAASATAKGLCR